MDEETRTHPHTPTNRRILLSLKIKRREILSFATMWVKLEGIMLIEISHAQKGKYCMIPHRRYLE